VIDKVSNRWWIAVGEASLRTIFGSVEPNKAHVRQCTRQSQDAAGVALSKNSPK
jgi:hypothetical protein